MTRCCGKLTSIKGTKMGSLARLPKVNTPGRLQTPD
jgi:hypothetical protein